MNKLEQLREEAERLANEGGCMNVAVPPDFFSSCRIGSRLQTTPTVYHFTHQPCTSPGHYHKTTPSPMSERTVACVMPDAPDNVFYHRAGECPRIDYNVDAFWEDIHSRLRAGR